MVLILVLVDLGGKVKNSNSMETKEIIVLILVLVDLGGKGEEDVADSNPCFRLNPCFGGFGWERKPHIR